MKPEIPQLNKKVIRITSLNDSREEDSYWKSKSYEERLNGIEINRRLVYGDAVTFRLQRFLEIARLPQS